jgi:outer membrane protein OmpA-like peptidoglycan-associated protein
MAGFVLAAFVSGCAATQKPWGQGAVGGAIVGAAALGTAGGVIVNNVNPPFKEQDTDRGAGIGIGIATGAILGALIGHVLFDPEAEPPPPPAPPPPPVRKKLVLRGVHFDFNKYNLRPEGKPILDAAAQELQANPNVSVQVQGYTDGIGSDSYNLALSNRRAETVRSYLIGRGVAAGRLSVRGFGKSNPVATNATEEGRAQNRRVELVALN